MNNLDALLAWAAQLKYAWRDGFTPSAATAELATLRARLADAELILRGVRRGIFYIAKNLDVAGGAACDYVQIVDDLPILTDEAREALRKALACPTTKD